MFFAKVVILYGDLQEPFQKECVFSSGEPRGTGRNLTRQDEYSTISKSELYHARRMFREHHSWAFLTCSKLGEVSTEATVIPSCDHMRWQEESPKKSPPAICGRPYSVDHMWSVCLTVHLTVRPSVHPSDS